MKVKDKKNNSVIAGLVLFLIIIIFGQQGNTFAGATDMGVAEKPTIAELKLVLEEGYEMIKGKGGALEYVEEQIKQQEADIKTANKLPFPFTGIGNKVREAAIKILKKIKLLMENINKNIIKLYDLLKKLENDQNKLKPADNEQIKSLVKLINSDLKKIDFELNKFNDPLFFITNPFTFRKKDLIEDERPALALAQQKVGDTRSRLKRFEGGVIKSMPMPGSEPLEPIKQPDKPPVIEPVKPGAPATEAQLKELREAQELLKNVEKWVEEARKKRKMKP